MISQLMSEAVRTRSTILRERLSAQLTAEYRLRCLSINTHRGQGPKLSLLRDTRSPEEAQRIALMHDTRAYAYFIAEWLNTHRQRYDVVALQEVFSGILGVGERIVQKYRQRDHYRVLSGFASYLEHGVGFAGFRYQNLLLSQMPKLSQCAFNRHLPGKVFFLASCGFTLAPFLLKDVIVWIGNTHLHAYSPAARMRQARSIAQVIRSLGDVPVVFMGDFNTVPEGFRIDSFGPGDIDRYDYRNDSTLRILEDAGLSTVHHADARPFHTYPTGMPNRTLDYIMWSRHWHVHDYGVLHDFTLSDHYPVHAELELKLRDN
ncbi:MAG TPA: endonuclease/exonuclease/phosphatase family protein [Bacteroidota bacterium]|nr:endonuclease/exonuclease/phosphatase family protein [Bacteroidota bacterium]